MGSTGGLGNIASVGSTGNGNTTQYAGALGNIVNEQWRLGLGGFLPSSTDSPETLTNEQVTSSSANPLPGLSKAELLALRDRQQGTSTATGTVVTPRPLREVATRIKDAVDATIDRITKPRTPATDNGAESQADQPNPNE